MELELDILNCAGIVHQKADKLSRLRTTIKCEQLMDDRTPTQSILHDDNDSCLVDPDVYAYFELEENVLFVVLLATLKDVQLPSIPEFVKA